MEGPKCLPSWVHTDGFHLVVALSTKHNIHTRVKINLPTNTKHRDEYLRNSDSPSQILDRLLLELLRRVPLPQLLIELGLLLRV